jgi:hypothetical protein
MVFEVLVNNKMLLGIHAKISSAFKSYSCTSHEKNQIYIYIYIYVYIYIYIDLFFNFLYGAEYWVLDINTNIHDILHVYASLIHLQLL